MRTGEVWGCIATMPARTLLKPHSKLGAHRACANIAQPKLFRPGESKQEFGARLRISSHTTRRSLLNRMALFSDLWAYNGEVALWDNRLEYSTLYSGSMEMDTGLHTNVNTFHVKRRRLAGITGHPGPCPVEDCQPPNMRPTETPPQKKHHFEWPPPPRVTRRQLQDWR